jgi:glycine cleavage system H protein
MNVPGNLSYTKDHEWLRVEGNEGYVGITDYAQGQLGDIVFVQVDTVGESISQEESFGTIDAVKTSSDLFMPVAAKVLELNPALEASPEIVNKDPYGDGWIIKISISDPGEVGNLLSPEKYSELISH